MTRYHTGSRTIQVMRNVLDPEGNPVLDDSGAPVTVLVNEVENFHEPFTAEEEAEWDAREAEEAARVIVPQAVTMRQARLALLGAGLLDTVTTCIAALPSPQKEAAQIEWEYSQEVHRGKALVGVLAPMLGLTDEQIDQLFITAATL